MLNQGKIDSARTESYNLESAVKTFYTIVGRYPTNAEGLDVLLNPPKGKPTLERLGKDPWGNPYQYLYPGTNNPNSVDIKSLGPDGQEGGGDDIGNWDTEAQ
jgi:general secretion pathway protein G